MLGVVDDIMCISFLFFFFGSVLVLAESAVQQADESDLDV
jgi:hypothetical protein